MKIWLGKTMCVIFKNTQPLNHTTAMCKQKTKFKVFYEWVKSSMWMLGVLFKVSSVSLRLSDPTTCSSKQPSSLSYLCPHKSLKIEVVNDQPTHFLLNTPPSHPLPETKLSSLALTSILFRTYPVIIEAEKKELPLSLFRSFNFDGPQIYGVGFLCLGVLATPPC